MFILRVVFWLGVMSFLFNGGTGLHPDAAYETPAHETAAIIVTSLGSLETFCLERPLICAAGEEIASFVVGAGAELLAYALERYEATAEEEKNAGIEDLLMRSDGGAI